MTEEQKKAMRLMIVGGMVGLGLPFAIAGMALHVTGTYLRIEIVKGAPAWISKGVSSGPPADTTAAEMRWCPGGGPCDIIGNPIVRSETLVRDPAMIMKLCHVANPVRPFYVDTSSDGHRVCTEVDQ